MTTMSDPPQSFTYLPHAASRDSQLSSYHQMDFSNFTLSDGRSHASTMMYEYPTMESLPLDSGYAADDLDPFDKSLYWPTDDSMMDVDQYSSHQTSISPDFQLPDLSSPTVTLPFNNSPLTELDHGFGMLERRTDCQTGLVNDVARPYTIKQKAVQQQSHPSQSMSYPTYGSPAIVIKDEAPSPSALQSSMQRPSIKRSLSDDSTDRSMQDTPVARGRPKQRMPHTDVERRYRENLNSHLQKLRAAVPILPGSQHKKSLGEDEGSDTPKPSKCEILVGAVDYIGQLEAENARLLKEIQQLRYARRC